MLWISSQVSTIECGGGTDIIVPQNFFRMYTVILPCELSRIQEKYSYGFLKSIAEY